MLNYLQQIPSSRTKYETQNIDFLLLIALRIALASCLLVFLDRIIEFETSLAILTLALSIGIISASYFSMCNYSAIKLLLAHLTLVLFFSIGLWSWDFIGSGSNIPANDFRAYEIASHLRFIFLLYCVGLVSTWFYWKLQVTDTFEALLLSVALVAVLSGHRNYQLDAPKQISEAAWQLNLAPQHLILTLGTTFLLLLGSYLFFSYTRPIFSTFAVKRSAAGTSRIATTLIPVILAGCVVFLAVLINRIYAQELSRVSSGVGMGGQDEGQSPLGFHSALGQSRQPAGLVRLESDFANNPWAPMIYFREGALSQFNGKEIVLAPRGFDMDTPRIQPGQPYVAPEKELTEGRASITQSIFLLTEHKNPFALDYPVSIRLLKNPDPERFNTVYQAESYAPVSSLEKLNDLSVFNPAWSEAEREHYLRAPGSRSLLETEFAVLSTDLSEPILDTHGEDLRYAIFAKQITENIERPLERAQAIAAFLSKVSIYTRSPGHQVTATGDPVAAYLFAEQKRGYCVHFAHAAVFLMRLVGIPSRIATGYLTDLSYAKDGHVLLHLGDRHAWPEVYVDGYGWVVVDISPEQAENEEPIIPDESLLEELMSKIDPGLEFITPPPPIDNTPPNSRELISAEAMQKTFSISLAVLLALFIATKALLYFGYSLFSDARKKMRFGYYAFAANCADLGLGREYGETRSEYALRLKNDAQIDDAKLAQDLSAIRYAKNVETLQSDTRSALRSITNAKGRWRRLLAFFNPASLFRIGKW